MSFEKRRILIIPGQSWGQMFLSKHHYAKTLAEIGHDVYFLDPADEAQSWLQFSSEIVTVPVEGITNLRLIKHRLYFPYPVKFHSRLIYNTLIKWHIRAVERVIGRIDIVWSFDLSNSFPLKYWSYGYKIAHPVDEPLHPDAIAFAEGADILFSVTREIIEKYNQFRIPKHFINHGVSSIFLDESSSVGKYVPNKPLRVGYSGNLLRGDIDIPVFKKMIEDNSEVIFEFWGSYTRSQSNIGSTESDLTSSFIAFLQTKHNVILHGVVSPATLAQEYRRMDAFLICYDVQKDQSKGTNYHKIMEYLSTGKVVVSNNVTTYQSEYSLIVMNPSREDNSMLPDILSKTLIEIEFYNDSTLQNKRIAYALSNTYSEQIKKILIYINH